MARFKNKRFESPINLPSRGLVSKVNRMNYGGNNVCALKPHTSRTDSFFDSPYFIELSEARQRKLRKFAKKADEVLLEYPLFILGGPIAIAIPLEEIASDKQIIDILLNHIPYSTAIEGNTLLVAQMGYRSDEILKLKRFPTKFEGVRYIQSSEDEELDVAGL